MSTKLQALGFYSIGLRNIDIQKLFSHLRQEDIPFLHLRSGPKGYGLTKLKPNRLNLYINKCNEGIPVTMLASDITLELLAENSQETEDEYYKLISIAQRLGAKYIRILAPSIMKEESLINFNVNKRLNSVVSVIELHNPEWFTHHYADKINDICVKNELGLLFDSLQIEMACQLFGVYEVSQYIDRLLPHVKVIHFSDSGGGFSGEGHQITALAAIKAQEKAYDIELAFEWTGRDRTAAAAFSAYRRAVHFWHFQCENRSINELK